MFNTKRSTRTALLASTSILIASGISGAAMAQDAVEEEVIEQIIVTGSLIRNPNLTRSAPVSIISSDEMDFQANNVVEEILREIPGMVPSVGAQLNNGNGGFSYVNLRGLGSHRNLVLVDGRRMAPSELNGRFDLNNIPIALLDRVDVLTGGASTTYGADAISGVVNFITKKDFTGFEANASYGTTQKGDGDTKRLEVTMGADFAGGKGNAVLSIGYQKSDPVYQGDRDFSENVLYYWDGTRGGSGLGPYNTRIGNVNPTGVEGGNLSLGGVQDDRTFAAAYTPYNYGPSNVFQTPFQRYNIYAAADYAINDNVEVYTKALFSKNNVNTLIAPSGSFGDSVSISLNHPNMSAAQRNAFCAFDTDSSATSYVPLYTPAQCDAAGAATGPTDPNYLTVDTQLRRRNVEGGPRISDYSANYFNYSLGFRGDISEAISWDVNGSYGQSDQTQIQKGYWMKSRFRQALLAGPDGCNDSSNGCVPADYFGPTGSITEEMNDFLLGGESAITIRFDMAQVSANISGETGYTVPWAQEEINFAVGADYRRYGGSRESDVLSQSGDLGGAGGAAPNIYGGYSVYEGVVEFNVPLVQDAEWAKNLTFETGLRYSNYTVDAETSPKYDTTTWKTGLSWTPIDDITVRATFARAVRAPNIDELFSPQNTLLTNLNIDPCASVTDAGVNSGFVPTGALADVCVAQGAPVGTLGFIPQPAAGQANYTGGGNLSVLPETSDSWTLGLIFQPAAVEGLTVTLDYYNIKIDGSINAPSPSDAIDACFNDLSIGNPACTGIVRSPIDGGLSGDNTVVKGLPLFQSNSGNLATDGIDLSIAYGREFGDVYWQSNFVGNWTNSSTFQATTGVSLDRECVGLYSADCSSIQPEYTFNWRNTLTYDKFDASLMWRHISSNTYEYTDTDPALVGDTADDLGPQDFNKTKAYNLFDLTVRYTVLENVILSGAVSNLMDKQPPLTGAFIGATGYNSGNTYPSTFDTLGRRFTLSARVKF